jgi:hypothetical protein
MITHPSTTDRGTSMFHDSAPLACERCGVIDRPRIGPGSGPHALRATCAHCGRHLLWVSAYTPEERQARRQAARAEAMSKKPPSQPQLTYLATLGDSGPPPTTMLEASTRIDSLAKKGRP